LSAQSSQNGEILYF